MLLYHLYTFLTLKPMSIAQVSVLIRVSECQLPCLIAGIFLILAFASNFYHSTNACARFLCTVLL